MKKGVAKCLIKRARDIRTDEDKLQKEVKHLTATLQNNSYPPKFLNRVIEEEEKGTRNNGTDEEEPKSTAVIPYIKGTSEKIRRIFRGYGIRTAFKTTQTLG